MSWSWMKCVMCQCLELSVQYPMGACRKSCKDSSLSMSYERKVFLTINGPLVEFVPSPLATIDTSSILLAYDDLTTEARSSNEFIEVEVPTTDVAKDVLEIIESSEDKSATSSLPTSTIAVSHESARQREPTIQDRALYAWIDFDEVGYDELMDNIDAKMDWVRYRVKDFFAMVKPGATDPEPSLLLEAPQIHESTPHTPTFPIFAVVLLALVVVVLFICPTWELPLNKPDERELRVQPFPKPRRMTAAIARTIRETRQRLIWTMQALLNQKQTRDIVSLKEEQAALKHKLSKLEAAAEDLEDEHEKDTAERILRFSIQRKQLQKDASDERALKDRALARVKTLRTEVETLQKSMQQSREVSDRSIRGLRNKIEELQPVKSQAEIIEQLRRERDNLLDEKDELTTTANELTNSLRLVNHTLKQSKVDLTAEQKKKGPEEAKLVAEVLRLQKELDENIEVVLLQKADLAEQAEQQKKAQSEVKLQLKLQGENIERDHRAVVKQLEGAIVQQKEDFNRQQKKQNETAAKALHNAIEEKNAEIVELKEYAESAYGAQRIQLGALQEQVRVLTEEKDSALMANARDTSRSEGLQREVASLRQSISANQSVAQKAQEDVKKAEKARDDAIGQKDDAMSQLDVAIKDNAALLKEKLAMQKTIDDLKRATQAAAVVPTSLLTTVAPSAPAAQAAASTLTTPNAASTQPKQPVQQFNFVPRSVQAVQKTLAASKTAPSTIPALGSQQPPQSIFNPFAKSKMTLPTSQVQPPTLPGLGMQLPQQSTLAQAKGASPAMPKSSSVSVLSMQQPMPTAFNPSQIPAGSVLSTPANGSLFQAPQKPTNGQQLFSKEHVDRIVAGQGASTQTATSVKSAQKPQMPQKPASNMKKPQNAPSDPSETPFDRSKWWNVDFSAPKSDEPLSDQPHGSAGTPVKTATSTSRTERPLPVGLAQLASNNFTFSTPKASVPRPSDEKEPGKKQTAPPLCMPQFTFSSTPDTNFPTKPNPFTHVAGVPNPFATKVSNNRTSKANDSATAKHSFEDDLIPFDDEKLVSNPAPSKSVKDLIAEQHAKREFEADLDRMPTSLRISNHSNLPLVSLFEEDDSVLDFPEVSILGAQRGSIYLNDPSEIAEQFKNPTRKELLEEFVKGTGKALGLKVVKCKLKRPKKGLTISRRRQSICYGETDANLLHNHPVPVPNRNIEAAERYTGGFAAASLVSKKENDDAIQAVDSRGAMPAGDYRDLTRHQHTDLTAAFFEVRASGPWSGAITRPSWPTLRTTDVLGIDDLRRQRWQEARGQHFEEATQSEHVDKSRSVWSKVVSKDDKSGCKEVREAK